MSDFGLVMIACGLLAIAGAIAGAIGSLEFFPECVIQEMD